MGRLGTRAQPDVVARAVGAAPARCEGLMTHFASSANYESSQTGEQIRHFEGVLAGLRAAGFDPRYVHASGTIQVAYQRREAWWNLVRPGHAIYGYVSPARGSSPKAPAGRETRAHLEGDRAGGERPGSGRFNRLRGNAPPDAPCVSLCSPLVTPMASAPLSNRGQVIAHGRLAPIVGAVSMDLTTIDVTTSPEIRVGDAVTLLGSEGGVSIDAQQMARLAGTISYGVLCGISARVKRVYVD